MATPTATSAAVLQLSSVASPDPVAPGGLITYVLTYANPGGVGVSGVTLTTTTPLDTTFVSASPAAATAPVAGSTGSVIWNLSDLPPGASGNVILVVQVDTGLADGTTISNVPYELASTAPASLTSGSEVDVQVQAQPGLVLAKVAGSDPLVPLQPFTYTLTYANAGSTVLDGVVVTETYDPGVTLLSSIPAPDPATDNQWTIGTLNPGDRGAIILTVQADGASDGTIVHNVASASTSGGQTSRATADVVLQTRPVMTFDLTATPDPVGPNGYVTYAITYANPSAAPLAGLVIRAGYDPGLTFVATSLAPDSGTNNQWTVGGLDAGANGTITVRTQIGAVPLGQLLQTVATLSDASDHSAARRTVTTVSQARSTCTLTAAPRFAKPGAKVTFSLQLRNRGQVPLSNVELHTTFGAPAGFYNADRSPLSLLPLGGVGEVIWTTPQLDPSRIFNKRVFSKLDPAAVAGTLVTADAICVNNAKVQTSHAVAVVGIQNKQADKVKITGSKSIKPQSRMTYQVSGAQGLRLQVTLPPEVTLLTAAPAPDQAPSVGSSGPYEWTAVGTSGKVKLTVLVNAGLAPDTKFMAVAEGRNTLGQLIGRSTVTTLVGH